jgi:hypothetical protein
MMVNQGLRENRKSASGRSGGVRTAEPKIGALGLGERAA